MSCTIKMKKSFQINDTQSNGGSMVDDDVSNGRPENVFPNVSGSERVAGMTRYRKVFIKKESGILNCAKFFIDSPSPAGDHFRIKAGTDSDVQADAAGYANWAGAGFIAEELVGGSSAVIRALLDSNDGVYVGSKIALVDRDNLTNGAPSIEYLDVSAVSYGIFDGCDNLIGWSDIDTANAETTEAFLDGLDVFKLTVETAGQNERATVSRDLGMLGNVFTVEIKTYFKSLGRAILNNAAHDGFSFLIDNDSCRLRATFGSDGLFVYNGQNFNEVGTDVVDLGVFSTWKFVANYTTPASATCSVYKNGILIASNVDCSEYPASNPNNGRIELFQHGNATNGVTTYVDFIRILDGTPASVGECIITTSTPCPASHSPRTRAKVSGTVVGPFDVSGKNLIIKIDGGPAQTITFSGNGLTVEEVVDAINEILSGANAYPIGSGSIGICSQKDSSMSSVQILSESTANDILGLDNSVHYGSDGTAVAGKQFEYAFDDIGNRKTNKFGGDSSGAGLRPASYSANNLNQYTSRTVPGYVNILETGRLMIA